MNFNRPDPADFSPVELAILRGLGVDRLDFRATAPREQVVLGKVGDYEKRLAEEKARLAEAGVGG